MGFKLGPITIGNVGPQAQLVAASASATGTVATLARLLGSTSTFSMVSGNSNLSVSGVTIQAAAALGYGASQQAVVREYDSGSLRAVEYPVTVTTPAGVPAAPTLGTPTAGNGQVSIPFTDGATNGAAITGHKVYRGSAAGGETLLGTLSGSSPFIDTGLTNGAAYYYKLSAVNSAGEGPLSAEASATPTASSSQTYLPTLSAQPLVYSLYRLYPGYTGPVAQLSRSSDSSTLTINTGSDGQSPDLSGVAAFASGTVVQMLRYDQGPGANGLEVQATKANVPILLLDAKRGFYGGFVGTNTINTGATAQVTAIPSGYSTNRNNATMIAVATATGGPGRIGLGTTSGVTNDLSLITNAGANILGGTFQPSNYAQPVDPAVIIGVSGATNAATTIRVDGRKKAVTAQAAAALTGGALYGSAVGYASGLSSTTFAHVIYPAALATADEASVAAALKTIFAVPSYADQVLFVGDSITFAQGALKGASTASLYAVNTPRRVIVANLGVPGTLFDASNNNPDAYFDAVGLPGKQIVITNSGTNDLGTGNRAAGDTSTSGTLIYSANAWIAARKAKGWTVAIQTLLPRYGSWTSAQEAERLKYNQWLRDNASTLGFTLADVASISQFQTSSTTYQVDGLHPTDAGYVLIEQFLRPILNGLL